MVPQEASEESITRSGFHHELEDTKSDARSLVTFDGPDDVYNPLNWPFSKKLKNTLLYGFTTMGSTWASSMYLTSYKASVAHMLISFRQILYDRAVHEPNVSCLY